MFQFLCDNPPTFSHGIFSELVELIVVFQNDLRAAINPSSRKQSISGGTRNYSQASRWRTVLPINQPYRLTDWDLTNIIYRTIKLVAALRQWALVRVFWHKRVSRPGTKTSLTRLRFEYARRRRSKPQNNDNSSRPLTSLSGIAGIIVGLVNSIGISLSAIGWTNTQRQRPSNNVIWSDQGLSTDNDTTRRCNRIACHSC